MASGWATVAMGGDVRGLGATCKDDGDKRLTTAVMHEYEKRFGDRCNGL